MHGHSQRRITTNWPKSLTVAPDQVHCHGDFVLDETAHEILDFFLAKAVDYRGGYRIIRLVNDSDQDKCLILGNSNPAETFSW